MTIPFHPLAELFPLIEGPQFDELVADIKANGLHEKIVLTTEGILDGRNRYRALIAAGLISEDDEDDDISAYTIAFGPRVPGWRLDGDKLDWVLSRNLRRRHLTPSQLSAVAAELGKLRQGRPSEWNTASTPTPEDANRSPPEDKPANLPVLSHVQQGGRDLTQAERAEVFGISERQVRTGDFVKEHAAPEVFDAVKRGEVAVSAAAEVAQLPVAEQLEILRSEKPQDLARVARERVTGNRALMADRREPDDSLDYFPTPPWATRALLEDVLHGSIGPGARVWEPACGEGHITGVLLEYTPRVVGTDIFDYGFEGRCPPGWDQTVDFLGDVARDAEADWIISNPPFGDKALPFILKALDTAESGVAMFVRTQCLEGIERFTELFSKRPPTLIAQFAERVPLHKGRWEPEGDTATMYCWLVWHRGWLKKRLDGFETKFMWIKPGRRVERSRPDDVARFTAHPVKAPSNTPRGESGTAREASGGQPLPGDGDIGDLKQGPEAAPRHHSHAKASEGKADITGSEPASDGDASRSSRADGAPAPLQESDLAETPIGGGEAESARGAAPDKAPQANPAPITREEAEPILRARYATTPGRVLADEFGVSVNTVRTWAFHFGLTNVERRTRELVERNRARGNTTPKEEAT